MSDANIDPAARPIRWGWILFSGIIAVLIGLAAWIWPFPATLAVTIAIGALLVGSGIVSIVTGFGGGGHATRWYNIGYGLLSLIVGDLMIFQPAAGAISLTLLVAIWLGVRGAMEIWWGWRLPRHRWGLIALGVLNIALDIFILATLPISGAVIPGTILAVSFIFGGLTEIWIALAYRDVSRPA